MTNVCCAICAREPRRRRRARWGSRQRAGLLGGSAATPRPLGGRWERGGGDWGGKEGARRVRRLAPPGARARAVSASRLCVAFAGLRSALAARAVHWSSTRRRGRVAEPLPDRAAQPVVLDKERVDRLLERFDHELLATRATAARARGSARCARARGGVGGGGGRGTRGGTRADRKRIGEPEGRGAPSAHTEARPRGGGRFRARARARAPRGAAPAHLAHLLLGQLALLLRPGAAGSSSRVAAVAAVAAVVVVVAEIARRRRLPGCAARAEVQPVVQAFSKMASKSTRPCLSAPSAPAARTAARRSLAPLGEERTQGAHRMFPERLSERREAPAGPKTGGGGRQPPSRRSRRSRGTRR